MKDKLSYYGAWILTILALIFLFLLASQKVSAQSVPMPNEYVVPTVVYIPDRYATRVTLFNPNDGDIQVSLSLCGPSGEVSAVLVSLRQNETRVYPLFLSYDPFKHVGGGSVLINSSRPVNIRAEVRLLNSPDPGTFLVPVYSKAPDFNGSEVYQFGLNSTYPNRLNLGAYNRLSFASTVTIEVVDVESASYHKYVLTVNPFSWGQINIPDPGKDLIVVWHASQGIYPFAVQVDQYEHGFVDVVSEKSFIQLEVK